MKSNQNSRKSIKPVKKHPTASKTSNPGKTDTQNPKKPLSDINLDSISDSMRSTPSTAQMISSFPDPPSSQNLESNPKRPGPVKIPTFEFIPDSPSPLSGKSPNNELFIRKDSKSLTTVNTPKEPASNETFKKAAENTRRTVRTKTDIQKPFHNYSNSLCSNFNNEKVPSRVSQKERKGLKSEILVHDIKFKQEDTEKWEPNGSRSYGSFLKGRSSVASNGSMSSFGFSEAQIDVLNDLTRSVKELNQRLIRSEEITYERLKENLALKTKIKSLENKIEMQEGGRVETEGINAGCSKGCLVF